METFRTILRRREEQGETDLYSAFCAIENEGYNSWLTLLSQKYNSYNSIPHLKGVERNIDQAVPEALKHRFNAKEIYLLLAAILLHDIGKVFDDSKAHGTFSCTKIQEEWTTLKIVDFESAKKIAVISCAHTWPKYNTPRWVTSDKDESTKDSKRACKNDCSLLCTDQNTEMNLTFDMEHGDLRLTWLATLLKLGDQVDNCGPRAVPKAFRGSEQGAHWRSFISSVEFDRDGRCIKLRTDSFNREQEWGQTPDGASETNYNLVLGELKSIEDVLKNWHQPLLEMGLTYEAAFIQTAIPANCLFSSKGESNGVHEAPFDEKLQTRVVEAAARLSYGIIGRIFFSWEILAAESGSRNRRLIKLAAQRIRSLKNECDLVEFRCSNETWVNRHAKEKYSSPKKGKDFFNGSFFGIGKVIPTEIDYLDLMLCPDNPEPKGDRTAWKGGIYYASKDTDTGINQISPVVSVQGGSGDGKTTLCTQIATNLVKGAGNQEVNPWIVFYYPLEQDYSRMIRGIKNYNFLEEDELSNLVLNCENPDWIGKFEENTKQNKGSLIFPRLSPILVESVNTVDESNFQRRLSELKDCIKWILPESEGDQKPRIVFILDSLTAFSDKPLNRNQIFRLFSLFRENHIPLIFTLERQHKWVQENAILSFNVARYLSDVEICLESQNERDYFRQTIEIPKTRYNRRILGQHQYKLVSGDVDIANTIDNRRGLVIYPSIHYHLSTKQDPAHKISFIPALANEDQLKIGRIKDEKRRFESNTCFVISGGHGCHKFALAMNLLLNHDPSFSHEKKPNHNKKLIISFAEEKEVILKKVALLHELESWRPYLSEKEDSNKTPHHGQKVWTQEFGIQQQDQFETKFKAIHFRMGRIMPEEVIFIVEKIIKKEAEQGSGFDSVLVNDTAHIRNLFPGLVENSIFIPALVDLIKKNGMYSVFIDVKRNDHMTKSLMSAADCRFLVKNRLNEVKFQIHNIRGKDYEQKTHYVRVLHNEEQPVLEIIPREEIE